MDGTEVWLGARINTHDGLHGRLEGKRNKVGTLVLV